MSFDKSWADAEKIVMRALCKATGAIEGQQAFRGYLPPVLNAYALFTGGQGGNEQTSWSPNVVSVHFGARIEMVFAQREHLQVFTMQVLKVLPLVEAPVQSFRVRQGGYPDPKFEYVPVGNEGKPAPAWTATIGCELVFSTGGR